MKQADGGERGSGCYEDHASAKTPATHSHGLRSTQSRALHHQLASYSFSLACLCVLLRFAPDYYAVFDRLSKARWITGSTDNAHGEGGA